MLSGGGDGGGGCLNYLLARSLFFFSFLTMNQNEIEIKYFLKR